MTKTIRTLIAANLTLGVAFGIWTILDRPQILDHLRATRPGTGPIALEAQLFTHQFHIGLFAIVYLVLLRGLISGDARAYRWLPTVTILATAGTGYELASLTYPGHLVPALALQAVLLLALLATATSRPARTRHAAACC